MAITSSVQALKQSPQIREHTQQVLQQTAQQRPNLSPELLDNTRLSDEFVDEVGKISETQGYDPNMLAALAGNFLEQKSQNQGGGDSQPADEAKKAEKVGGNKPKRTIEAKWDPMVRSGEVIPKQGKLGEVTSKITTYPDDDDKKDDKKADKAKNSKAPSQVQAPQSAAGAQKTGGANQAPKSEQSENAKNDEKDEKVEFSQETKDMLNQMHAQGMKTPGLDPNQGGAGSHESKPVGEAKGAGGGGKKPTVTEKTDELLMPSQGLTQAVKVRERGEIKNGDVILTYRKLDDLPSGSVAILKNKTGKEGIDEYAKRIQEGDKVPPLNKEQQRQLLDPIAEK
ncbi:hypothetical protein JST97_25155 [bacterium]|nr:hypothetical protein [bacterium]